MPNKRAEPRWADLTVAARTRLLLRGLLGLGEGGVRALEEQIAEASRRLELTYTHDDGKTHVIPLLGTPALLARADAEYLRGLCLLLVGAFKKTVNARARDPEIQALLPVEPGEAEWLRLAPPLDAAAPIAARWDLNVPATRRGAARRAQLFEMNGCAVGGIHYSGVSSEIVQGALAALPAAGGRALRLPDAMRDVWLALLDGHGRAIGRPAPRVAWLEDRSWDTGITEGPSLVTHLVRTGRGAVLADPRDLALKGGELCCHGLKIDLAYRSIELRDLVEIEAQDGELTALREAVRRGQVVSHPAGDLDHKSLLEVWTSPRFARLFTAAERAAFRRHVPWTRLIGARRSEGPDGEPIDLPAFTRKARARLVIKPNRDCGGEGVLLGPETRPAAWDKAIAGAISGRAPAVVQSLVHSATLETPVVGRRGVELAPQFTTYGLFATPHGLGILGRAAPFPVVNVARGGGLLGVLLV